VPRCVGHDSFEVRETSCICYTVTHAKLGADACTHNYGGINLSLSLSLSLFFYVTTLHAQASLPRCVNLDAFACERLLIRM